MLVRQHSDRKSGEYLIIARFASSLGKKYFCTFKVSWHFWKYQELKVALRTISDQIWIVFTTCFHKQSHCLQSNCVGRNLWADINQRTRIPSSAFPSESCKLFVCVVFLGSLRFTAATWTSSVSSVLLTAFVSVIYFFVYDLLYFGFYFQEKMGRGLQASSDNPSIYND